MARINPRMLIDGSGDSYTGPGTTDADPLAAIQAAVAASKNKVSEKNAEIARIALEQAVNTGNTRAASDAAAKLADAEGVTGAAKAAAIGDARKDAQATVESDREASKPTDDPGPGNIWSYSVSEGRWKKIKVSNVTEPVVDTTGYKVVNGVLQFNGQPFTGTYNGQTYENGIVKSAADTTGYKVVNGVLLFNGQPFSGTYSGQTYENGKVKLVTDGNNNNATGYQEVGGVLQFNGKPFTGTFAGTVYENGVKKVTTAAVTATNTLTSTQQDVMSIVLDRLNRYNLGSLAPLIKKLAIEGASEATIMLRLQDEPLYQERFKANQQRIKKGISVLTPSEYLNLEDSYRQILRAYGLNQFDNDAYVGQFISNDVSPTELSNRVVTAVQRVRNADPAVSNMLKNYYGIGQNDLVAYVLDPNQQFQKIERQVAASEIGVAAGRQGINIGVPVAEQLAAQGITRAEAQRGYATIADVLPTAEKLSGIYGTTLDKYGLEEGEQEVFNTLASAQRKRQRLIGREAAEFSGQSGISRSALGTSTGGQY
jgi:hypothetical protein